MKTSMLSAAIVGGLALAFSAGSALAQTCDSPAFIASNATTEGTTCGGEVGINLGGIPLVHPAVVHGFIAQDAEGLVVTSGDPTISALITPDCSTAPILIGNSFDVGSLVDGQEYLLIITSDELSAPDPQICGDFSVTTGTLPVELQEFSID